MEQNFNLGIHGRFFISSKRIFVLGPSHVVYLSGCALTTCAKYQTPLGDLVVDAEGKSLTATYIHLG